MDEHYAAIESRADGPGGDDSPAPVNELTPGGLGSTTELAARLRRIMILLRRQVRREDPSELTIAQLSALATVVRAGPIGVGQLAEAEVLPSPAVTRLADKLEQAGLISRQPNPGDRRSVLLVATEAGLALMGRREEASNAWLAKRLEHLAEPDREALQRAVDVLEHLTAEREVDKETVR